MRLFVYYDYIPIHLSFTLPTPFLFVFFKRFIHKTEIKIFCGGAKDKSEGQTLSLILKIELLIFFKKNWEFLQFKTRDFFKKLKISKK